MLAPAKLSQVVVACPEADPANITIACSFTGRLMLSGSRHCAGNSQQKAALLLPLVCAWPSITTAARCATQPALQGSCSHCCFTRQSWPDKSRSVIGGTNKGSKDASCKFSENARRSECSRPQPATPLFGPLVVEREVCCAPRDWQLVLVEPPHQRLADNRPWQLRALHSWASPCSARMQVPGSCFVSIC